MSLAPLAAKDRRGEGGYMQSHSQMQSDCYPILLNIQSHSHEATGTPRLINMHSHSCEATGTPRLINMQSRSRRRGVAASCIYFLVKNNKFIISLR